MHVNRTGAETGGDFAANIHIDTAAGENGAAGHGEGGDFRVVGHEGQFSVNVSPLLCGIVVAQQGGVNGHLVNRQAGEWRQQGAVGRVTDFLDHDFAGAGVFGGQGVAVGSQCIACGAGQPARQCQGVVLARCQVTGWVEGEVGAVYQYSGFDQLTAGAAQGEGVGAVVAVLNAGRVQRLGELQPECGEVHDR